MKIGILGSGRGTNFEAIADAIDRGVLKAEMVVVISDVENALILEKAKQKGIPHFYIPPGKYQTRLDPQAEKKYVTCLKEHGVTWVVLAGFMRVLKEIFFENYSGKILNIHPSLLPSFRGLKAWSQALDYGVKITGCTVHAVDGGVDTGPIILQEAVRVEDSDNSETLHARIQELEHRLYPQALQLIAEGKVEFRGRRVVMKR